MKGKRKAVLRVVMYTDGSAQGNPGPGGYAVLLRYKGQRKTLSGGYYLSTNNRMELMAVIKGLEGLEALEKEKEKSSLEVHVYSDSKYMVDAVEKGWLEQWVKKGFKKKKNPDLWRRYIAVASEYDVHLHWVKGHAGIRDNDYCDEVARKASLRPTQRDEGYEAQLGDLRDLQRDQCDIQYDART